MIRDSLMSERYFKAYIEEEEERIQKFKKNMYKNEVREDRLFSVERKIDSLEFGVLIAKYSRGVDISELEHGVNNLISNMPVFWNEESIYVDMVWMMSLGIMLGVSKDTFSVLTELVDKYNRHDGLLDFFSEYKLNNNIVLGTADFTFENPYGRLREVIESPLCGMTTLKEYLANYWYDGHKEMGWYDIHKSKEKLYSGYWSFESGAVAKILNINDDELKGMQYYPYDLVHYK